MLLPAPLGPDQGDLLAGSDVQVHPAQRLEPVRVAEVDVLQIARPALAPALGRCRGHGGLVRVWVGMRRLALVGVLVHVRFGGHWRGSHRMAMTS